MGVPLLAQLDMGRANISKHISISLLCFIISISCFAGLLKLIAQGGVLARSFCPRGRGFTLSRCPGGGNSPFQKTPRGFAGGISGLELTDT